MTTNKITESQIETFTIEILKTLGWQHVHGLSIAPGAEFAEREGFDQIILTQRLRKAVAKLNPDIPADAQEQAVQKVLRIYSPDLLHNNETFHQFLIEKIKIPYQQDGYERSFEVALIDFAHPSNNEFLVVNQYTIVENNQNKRPDILLFINGIPIVLFELKNAADETATIKKAFDQIQTYKATIPGLFAFNEVCIISDGMDCRAGSVSAGFSRYMTWKSADGKKEASRFIPQLEILIKGMLNPTTLLDLVCNFIIFEKSKKKDPKTGITQVETEKKLAAYHQYYAVNKAVENTIKAASTNGNRKGGVVWHTQGSGKSISMVFYSAKLVLSLNNPTVVVITDRNDLDDQLFDTFAASKQLLRQEPVQARDREHLKQLLNVASGGIVFTTIQKFLPEAGKAEFDRLSDRRNIVVIADEAHRTQYGFEAKLVDVKDKETKDVIGKRIAYGFAKYMRDALPNATYIGFTGTPIESTDVNTPAVFGQYVDIYDISQSVADGATVKIYYESRLAKVNLDEEGKRLIAEFDKELEEDEEITDKQRVRAKWAKLEAIVGNPERIKNLARDIVTHFELRTARFEGKGMVVAMSRRIAVDLYNEITKLRPQWHNDDLSKGAIKVVMTASSADGPVMQKHHTTKSQRRDLSDRMKDPEDPLRLVIVIDMWLTGFDVPCLHTLYVDKPMRDHSLMQAIARVNRVFRDKPGGLVVDYLGIATDLKKALSFYSNSGGKGDPAEGQEKAVAAMLEKLEIVRQLFFEESKSKEAILIAEPTAYYGKYPGTGFNYRRFFSASPQEKLSIILQAEEHIMGLENGKNRLIREVTMLSQAFALSVPDGQALAITDEVAFFQAVKARLVKFIGNGGGRSDLDIETTIKQIVDEALSSDQVIDIFDAAGIKKPEISILSQEFLQEIKGMKHQNLALELLKKILNDEIRTRSKTNLVKSKALLEMLETAIKKYNNGLLTTAEIIQFLVDEVAKKIKENDEREAHLGLSKEELAFYDALAENGSAVEVLGDDKLRIIAIEVAEKVKANATIDWTIRESARAKLMVLVKRTLNKYGYPPDMQQKAIDTVLKQAELLADYFVRGEA
ncbi:MAG: type I restriction endonuclease subunit R [Candidatus Methanoperedens sp.]|nr:type I restriction endonuclease subunit R [Candidatus Methanoperedens sp.]MCZ7369238.1 type I restriction endonuclease subunit R [Candidatus Methanoperedens sp.]